jgi:hypothetical protein
MHDWSLRVPVAFLIYKRPDTTARVFEAIRQARPHKLLIVADGPRPDHPGEVEQCAATRAIVEQIDWDCEVLRNYSDANLGCKQRVSSGLDWVFEQVEEAIILEDDCLPHPSFFRFCEELLDLYRPDERVMHISGNNFQFDRHRTNDSFYFSRYNHIWGWATWRRAWKHYDVSMSRWPELKQTGWLDTLWRHRATARYWERVFQSVYDGKIDTWDCQWTFACWASDALSILPDVNLVSNIGFGEDAHHTVDPNSRFANMLAHPMRFPLRRSNDVIVNQEADVFTFEHHYNPRFLDGLKYRIWSMLHIVAWRARFKKVS